MITMATKTSEVEVTLMIMTTTTANPRIITTTAVTTLLSRCQEAVEDVALTHLHTEVILITGSQSLRPTLRGAVGAPLALTGVPGVRSSVRAVGEMAVVRLVSDRCQLCVGCNDECDHTSSGSEKTWLWSSDVSRISCCCLLLLPRRTTLDEYCLITGALFVVGNCLLVVWSHDSDVDSIWCLVAMQWSV